MPSANLPIEYQEVEYLESSGTQWIDTGYMAQSNSWASLEYEITSTVDSWRAWFGNSNSFGFQFSAYVTRIYASVGTGCYANPNGSREAGVYSSGTHGIATVKEGSVVIDTSNGNHYQFAPTSVMDFTSNAFTVLVFACRSVNGSMTRAHPGLRIYSLTFFENDTPMVELVPCYRISDEKPGMYDTVSDTFLTNQGTGEFIVGPMVYPSHERVTAALEMAWRRRALTAKAKEAL